MGGDGIRNQPRSWDLAGGTVTQWCSMDGQLVKILAVRAAGLASQPSSRGGEDC